MSETGKRWVRLDPSTLNTPRKKDVHGVEFQVLLSPFDVPEAVRGAYDQRLGRFVIEFKYMDHEPHKKEKHSEHTWVRVGKHSERLMGLEIDVEEMKANLVALKIVAAARKEAIEAIGEAAGTPSRRSGTYKIAKHVIKEKWREVFEELIPA